MTVTGDCKKEGAISVRPPLAEVRDRDNLMRWRIDTPGYEFEPGKGIDFSLFSPFKELKSHDPKVARVLNRNDGLPGDYKYDVNIKGCKSLDPWVRNTE